MAEGMPDLGQKLGPLPVGAWAVIVVGGIGVGVYMNRRAARNAAAQPQQTTESGVGVGGSGFDTVTPGSTGSSTPDTNESWRMKATNGLIAKGLDPATVDRAIRQYLSGQKLNIQEQAIVSSALATYGVPPESVPGPPPTGPVPVAGLTATLLPTLGKNYNGVLLNWIPSPGATSYSMTYEAPGEPTATEIATAPPNEWGVAPNKQIKFTVIARNDYGDSDPRVVSVLSGDPPGRGNSTAKPPPSAAPPAAALAQPQTRQYTIQNGDTLTGIALKMYGNPGRAIDIYNANQGAIESAARAHGRTSAVGPNGSKGWYIYPGISLMIP